MIKIIKMKIDNVLYSGAFGAVFSMGSPPHTTETNDKNKFLHFGDLKRSIIY